MLKMKQGNMRKIAMFVVLAMFITTFIPVTQTVQAASTFYYVGGDNASDANPGTASSPFATIQAAANVAEPGDIVNIRTGTYRETITPANSGTAENPIVYQPDGDAVVTVSGADTADGGWSVYSGNIYQKDITLPVTGYNNHMTSNTTLMANQVFVEKKMMIEARWPNLPDSDDLMNRADWRDAKAGTWVATTGTTLTDSEIPNIPGGWVGGQMWITGWFIAQTSPITYHSGSQIKISKTIADPKFREFYYLTGKLGALDTAKEWFYDGTKLYLWSPDGTSPEGVEVKMRNYAFDLSNKSHITINNINVFAASITTNTNSTNITLDGLHAKYINHSLTLTESDIIYSHFGETGIRLMGQNSIIKNSIVEYSSGQGIVLGEGNIANNNLVHDIGYEGSYASGICPDNNTNNQKITHNTIYRTGRSSVDLRASKNVEIAYNDMYEYGLSNIDMGAIYSCRSLDLTGLRIHHNWIHDSKALAGGEGIQTGIYLDQGCGPAQVDHNVLWNNFVDYYNQHEGPEKIFTTYNNTFASTNYASYVVYSHPNKDIATNNIYRKPIITVDSATYAIRKDTYPKFVNEGNGGLKYRIRSDSPAVDAGAVIEGVTDGYVGDAPDIGAYEFGGEDWVAGYSAEGFVPTYYASEVPITEPEPEQEEVLPLGKIAIDDEDTGTGENQYEFIGNWNASVNMDAYKKTDHYNATKDDSYIVRFTGTQAKVYGEKNTGFGIVAISIDGGAETLVDCYSASRAVNTLLYSSPTLTYGSHYITVRITGEKNENAAFNWSTADRVVVTTGIATIDDSDIGTDEYQYEFVGMWNGGVNLDAYNNTDHYSGTKDDYYQVKFTGTQAKVYGEKNNSFGIVAISVDGGEETLVDCYSDTRKVDTLLYESPKLSYGTHYIKVRITGDKNESSESYWTTADRVEITLGVTLETVTVDDEETGTGENQYEFVGIWNAGVNQDAYNDTDHYSGTKDDYYQVRFTGTQVKVYGEKNASFGIVAISIDGGAETLVDCYSATRMVDTLLYESPALTYGSHYIKVRITGDKNESSESYWTTADRVVVTTSELQPAETFSIDDEKVGTGENQYEYVGTWNAGVNMDAYNDTDHYNNKTNDYYIVRFTGIQAKVYGEKNSGFGKVAISIDGGVETLVDCYSASRAVNSLLYVSPVLSDGSHWIKVRLTGYKNESSGGYYTTADRVVITTSGKTDNETEFVPVPVSPDTPPVEPTAPPINISQGKTATQSSTYAACVAGRALDGNTDGNGEANISHTQSDAQAWWMVDLGGEYKISDITIWNRTDSEMGRLRNFNIIVLNSDNSVAWTSHQEEHPNPSLTVNAGRVTGRFVKIQLDGTECLHMAEVQVFQEAQDAVPIPMPTTELEPDTGTKYEAEDGSPSGGAAFNDDHTGYSGQGFLGGFGTSGAAIEFSVNATYAGEKAVTLCYANGDPMTTLTVFLNGQKVNQIELQGTGSWDTWGYKTVNLLLNAGVNTISYMHDAGDTGAANLDYISVPFDIDHEPAPGTKYEGEDAVFEGGAKINDDHLDFSGIGFIDGFGVEGASLTFTVNTATAGRRDITLRYANGDSKTTLSVYVNGIKIKQFSLPGTGSWDTWGNVTNTLALNAGVNTITYKYDPGDNARVNIDYISVAGDTPATNSAPSKPTNLEVADKTTETVSLTWAASSDSDEGDSVTYDVYRNNEYVATVDGVVFEDTGLEANTEYTYYVKAKDNHGNVSVASDVLTVTTLSEISNEYEFTVGDVQFTDVLGEVITAIPASGLINAEVTLRNTTETAQQATLIVALYDAGGDIQNLSYITKNVAAGSTENFTAGFKLPSSHDGYTIKVMVWDSFAHQGALSEVVTLQ